MLIKIKVCAASDLPDDLDRIPYLAMMPNPGCRIDLWRNQEKLPSKSYRPEKGARPLSCTYNDTVSILHSRWAKTKGGQEKRQWIFRHYCRGGESFRSWLMLDVKGDLGGFDEEKTPSFLTFLWLSPTNVRVEVDDFTVSDVSIKRRQFSDVGLIGYFPTSFDPAVHPSNPEVWESAERERARNGLIGIVRDTMKAIKSLKRDLSVYSLSPLNPLMTCEEMMPLLRRTPFGIFLDMLDLEPPPKF
jgi:hypothetical protein